MDIHIIRNHRRGNENLASETAHMDFAVPSRHIADAQLAVVKPASLSHRMLAQLSEILPKF